MIRLVLENILLFLLPTALYLAYVLLTQRPAAGGGVRVLNEAPLAWLFVAGAAIVVATFVYFATVTPGGAPGQVYIPPHMGKDGRIEPGVLK